MKRSMQTANSWWDSVAEQSIRWALLQACGVGMATGAAAATRTTIATGRRAPTVLPATTVARAARRATTPAQVQLARLFHVTFRQHPICPVKKSAMPWVFSMCHAAGLKKAAAGSTPPLPAAHLLDLRSKSKSSCRRAAVAAAGRRRLPPQLCQRLHSPHHQGAPRAAI